MYNLFGNEFVICKNKEEMQSILCLFLSSNLLVVLESCPMCPRNLSYMSSKLVLNHISKKPSKNYYYLQSLCPNSPENQSCNKRYNIKFCSERLSSRTESDKRVFLFLFSVSWKQKTVTNHNLVAQTLFLSWQWYLSWVEGFYTPALNLSPWLCHGLSEST